MSSGLPAADAETTRDRILAAAVTEFATHGFAGARVDRIAREAHANVRMIYAHFGSKAALFDTAHMISITAMADTVPPTPDDLPGWAGRLFDYHATEPRVLRIALWAQLERPDTASEPMQTYLTKAAQLNRSATAAIREVDLLAFIYAVAQAWYLTPRGLLAADGSDPKDPERIRQHRAALVTAVRYIVDGGKHLS